MAVRDHDRVRFDVGKRIFETTTTTLANTCRDSMLDDKLIPDGKADHFIDRSPNCLFVLCKGELHPSPSPFPFTSVRLLYKEATFYALLDHVHAAKFGLLTTTASATPPPTPAARRVHGDGTAIRAAPDDAGPLRCVFFFL